MMMHKNKLIRVILPAMLLICLLALSATVVFADDTPKHSLAVSFDSGRGQVTYSVDGGEEKGLSNNTAVDIDRSSRVTVSIKPNSGYELKEMWLVEADGTRTKQDFGDPHNPGYVHDSLNRDVRLELVFVEKTYYFYFVPVEGDYREYDFVTDPDKYIDGSLSCTYGDTAGVEIVPVIPKSGGYRLAQWEVVDKQADGSYKLVDTISVVKDADGNPTSLHFSLNDYNSVKDCWQRTGNIYLRPVFEPITYAGTRYDYEIVYTSPDNSTYRLGDYLGEVAWSAPMGTVFSGKWGEGDANPHIGFAFDTFTKGTDRLVNTDPALNIVYRFFVPIEYALVFDVNGGDALDPALQPAKHIYNKDTALPTVTRRGYAFKGWSVWVGGVRVDTVPVTQLDKKIEAYALNNADSTITLKAVWEPVSYNISYDLVDGTPNAGDTLPSVYVFDTALVIPNPIKADHEFAGWIVNGDTEHPVIDLTLAAETYDAPITLTATWKAQMPLSPEKFGLVSRIDYPGEIFHFTGILSDLWLNEGDAGYLPMPEGITSLTYTVWCGEESVTFTVAANGVSTQKIPDSFFGKTVEVRIHTADNSIWCDYRGTLTLAGRPAAPGKDRYDNTTTPPTEIVGEIKDILWSDYYIEVQMKDGIDLSLYEFALSIDGGVNMMRDWQSSPRFENLHPGTVYWVYIRLKATDATPHGLAYVQYDDTTSATYKAGLKAELDAMIQETDGTMLRVLIQNAKDALDALEPGTATFYEDAEKIMADTRTNAPFARLQDKKMADLTAYRDALLAKGGYSEENKTVLISLCQTAMDAIKLASASADVESIYTTAYVNMTNVPIAYLQSGDLFITAPGGLFQDTVLNASAYPDFSAQIQNVNNAIAAGKVIYNGSGISQRELLKLLNSQEVIGAYRVKLTLDNNTLGEQEQPLQMKLLLPDELKNTRSLRVAYYGSDGTLLVLDTQRDGDYLLFTASYAADFVILGDPVMNLTGPIIALAIVILCQLIAIGVILTSRIRDGKAVRHSCMILPLPLLLTVQYLPEKGDMILLILGAVVILLQILLMYLLLTSEVVHSSLKGMKRYRRKEKPAPAPEAPAEKPEEDTDDAVTAFVPVETAEEADPAPEMSDEASEAPDEESRFDDIWGSAAEAEPVALEETEEAEEMAETEDGVYDEEYGYTDVYDTGEDTGAYADAYAGAYDGDAYAVDGEYPGYDESEDGYTEEYTEEPVEEYAEEGELMYPEEEETYGGESDYAYADTDAMGYTEEEYTEEEEFATGDVAEDDLYNIPEADDDNDPKYFG